MSGNPAHRELDKNDVRFALAMFNSSTIARYRVWIPAVAVIALLAGIGVLLWWGAQPPARPKYMPANSIWVDAPALPFSWHHGWWLGCWIDSDGHSNRCRLWGAGLEKPIVFEGQYISCETHSPVAAEELRLKAPPDSMQMWVGVATKEISAPAAFLENDKHLVPVESPHGCEELRNNLKRSP
jgi:hypothetical protein